MESLSCQFLNGLPHLSPFMEKRTVLYLGSWLRILSDPTGKGLGRRCFCFCSFQWTRLHMGLCIKGATFPRAMTLVLRSLEWEEVIVYLDDVIVMGTNFSDTLSANVESLTVSVRTIWNSNPGNATFSRKRWRFWANWSVETVPP